MPSNKIEKKQNNSNNYFDRSTKTYQIKWSIKGSKAKQGTALEIFEIEIIIRNFK